MTRRALLFVMNFYSRPCGRGDSHRAGRGNPLNLFLLTPLREGRRYIAFRREADRYNFYSRPCGRGDRQFLVAEDRHDDFYSRPCGRGDTGSSTAARYLENFYSRPCGRGDF